MRLKHAIALKIQSHEYRVLKVNSEQQHKIAAAKKKKNKISYQLCECKHNYYLYDSLASIILWHLQFNFQNEEENKNYIMNLKRNEK